MIQTFMIVNRSAPRVLIFEPSSQEKRKYFASIYGRKKCSRKTLSEIKEELRGIRVKNRKEMDKNVEKFKKTLSMHGLFKIHMAPDPESLIKILKENTTGRGPISLNKSNVVLNEIRPYLKKAGFRSYIRYFSEFENFNSQKKFFTDYWMLPGLHEKNILETFDLEASIDLSKDGKGRDYISLLGVNAASAESGNIFFLQHMSNIKKDIEEASIIFFIVSTEKVLENDLEAKIQVSSTGIFGLESVILDLKPKEEEVFDFKSLPFTDKKREIHVIIFDNGRNGLLSTPFSDLLLCIDCRACARQCPVGQYVPQVKEFVYSPKNLLLLQLQGRIGPFELCLHCGRCEVECPVGIPIPELLWRAKIDYYEKKGRSITKIALDDPELLAKIGVFFSPLSNWVTRIPFVRLLMWLFPGIHFKAPLPSFSRQTFRDWYRRRKKNG